MANVMIEGEDGDDRYQMWCWNEGLLINKARNGNSDGGQGDDNGALPI